MVWAHLLEIGSDKGESKMTKAMVVGTWGAFICALGCGPQYAISWCSIYADLCTDLSSALTDDRCFYYMLFSWIKQIQREIVGRHKAKSKMCWTAMTAIEDFSIEAGLCHCFLLWCIFWLCSGSKPRWHSKKPGKQPGCDMLRCGSIWWLNVTQILQNPDLQRHSRCRANIQRCCSG